MTLQVATEPTVRIKRAATVPGSYRPTGAQRAPAIQRHSLQTNVRIAQLTEYHLPETTLPSHLPISNANPTTPTTPRSSSNIRRTGKSIHHPQRHLKLIPICPRLNAIEITSSTATHIMNTPRHLVIPTRHLPPARLAAPAHRIRRTETSTIAEPEKTLTGPALVVKPACIPVRVVGLGFHLDAGRAAESARPF